MVHFAPGANYRKFAQDIGSELVKIQSFVAACSYAFTGAAMSATTGSFGTTNVTTFTSLTGYIGELITQNMVSPSGYISNLFVDNYSVKNLSIGIYIPASLTGTIGSISINSITGASGNFETITGTFAYNDNTLTPLLTGSSAFFTTITGTNIQALSQIVSSTGTFIYSNSNNGHINILQADNYAYPDTGIVENLNVLDTLTGNNAFVTNITGGDIFCDNLTCTSAFFTEIIGETINVSQFSVASITGETVNITALTGANFYSSMISSPTITGANVSISKLTSPSVTGTDIIFSSALTCSSITGSNIYATQTTVPSVVTDVVSSYTSGNSTSVAGTKFLSSSILSMRRLLTKPMLAVRAVTSWTTGIAASNMAWASICWSPENNLFVSVAPGPRVQISSDGINWSLRAGGAFNWVSICWSSEKNLFIACAYASTNQFMYSSNGSTWTADATIFPASPRSICYSPELGIFCAIDPTVSQSMISSNGLSWTSYGVSSMVNGRICWSSELGLFCAVGAFSPYALTSSDGRTWTSATSIHGDSYFGICWCPELNLFCAVGGLTISISSNGLTWISRTSPIGGAVWNSISWSPELKILVATSSSGIGYSSDGISWNSSSVPEGNNWDDICWSKALGIFCAVSSNGTNRVMISRYVKKCY